jgi:hypothetical protein
VAISIVLEALRRGLQHPVFNGCIGNPARFQEDAMFISRVQHAFSSATLIAALFALGCSGTSGVGKTFPVRGKVTLNDQPLAAGTAVVLYKPDASKGNSSPWEPTANVDKEGNYSLTTNGKAGAPPGWYKVIVTATESGVAAPNDPKRGHPHPRSLVHAKYGQAKTTDLVIEVIENPGPGAYDLKLKQ